MRDELDEHDLKILSVLATDGRISWAALAEKTGLSATPTLRRVRELEKKGYIQGYQAKIDEQLTGHVISVFVSVSLTTQTDTALARFESHVKKLEEVMSCFMMSGEFDYLLRVVVPDLHGFQDFISVLTRIPGVSRVTSSFAVKGVIARAAPPLKRAPRAKAAT